MGAYHAMGAKRYTNDSAVSPRVLFFRITHLIHSAVVTLFSQCQTGSKCECSFVTIIRSLIGVVHSLDCVSLSSFYSWIAPQFVHTDRDSARWMMDPKTVQRRRSLFWEIYCNDLLCVRQPLSLLVINSSTLITEYVAWKATFRSAFLCRL